MNEIVVVIVGICIAIAAPFVLRLLSWLLWPIGRYFMKREAMNQTYMYLDRNGKISEAKLKDIRPSDVYRRPRDGKR